MKIRDLYKKWKWTDAPNLGDIYKKKSDLVKLFGFREQLVDDVVFHLKNPMSTRGILVSGLPGVGKTTFLNYINKKYFPETMTVISLAGRLSGAQHRGQVHITEEQFLYIFEKIETFLKKILDKANVGISKRDDSELRKKFEKSNSNLPFKEYTRDILIPLCEEINRLTDIPQYYIAIDDVDYIYPTEQEEILSVISDLIIVSTNPIILYSARPPAAGIARNHLATLMAHNFGEPIDLDPINSFDVIKSRLSKCSSDECSEYGPYFNNKDTEKFFVNMSNNNLRSALDLATAGISEAPKYLSDKKPQYCKETLVSALYGRKSISVRDQKDIDKKMVSHLE